MGVTAGVAERGESVKTGSNQGTVFTRIEAARATWALKLCRSEGEPLFSISQATYRRTWHKVAQELGLPVGPPHDIRHSGPSEDFAAGRRTLQEIQHRGRWRSKKSIERYVLEFDLHH